MFTPRSPNARPAIQTGLWPYRSALSDQSASPPAANAASGDPKPMVPGDIPDVPPSGLSTPDQNPSNDPGTAGESSA
jgi:hypothetical protein